MPTTQTVAPNPPWGADEQIISISPLGQYILLIASLNPLRLVNTSGGNYSESVPPPGNNNTTGLSNQNQEITYKKITSDGNTFTLLASSTFPEGPLTLTAQNSHFKIKSDGNKWYVSG